MTSRGEVDAGQLLQHALVLQHGLQWFSGTRPVVPMHAEDVFTAAVLPVLEQLYLCKWARPRDVSKHVGRAISQY